MTMKTIHDISTGDRVDAANPPLCCGRPMELFEGFPGESALLECPYGESQIYLLDGVVTEPPAVRCQP